MERPLRSLGEEISNQQLNAIWLAEFDENVQLFHDVGRGIVTPIEAVFGRSVWLLGGAIWRL